MKRRDFIQKASLASAGVMATSPLLSHSFDDGVIKTFGFQAYTVRDVIYQDMAGTLKTLKKAGYDHVELFDFQAGKILGKPIQEAKAILKKSKIDVKSIHVPTGSGDKKISGTINHEFQRAIDDAKELGAEYLVCPYLNPSERKNIDQYKKLAELLQKSGEMCARSGLGFAYHNHEFEFQEMDGEIPFDILLDTDPSAVQIELDIYWTRFAEQNPLTIFKENSGRVALWHVKDLSLDEGKPMTELGNGIIDWKQIFKHKEESGMKYFFIEQDRNFANNSLDSLATSLKYLKKLNY